MASDEGACAPCFLDSGETCRDGGGKGERGGGTAEIKVVRDFDEADGKESWAANPNGREDGSRLVALDRGSTSSSTLLENGPTIQ